jgi:hypothetical protein
MRGTWLRLASRWPCAMQRNNSAFASETLSFRRPRILCASERMALHCAKLGPREMHTAKTPCRKCFFCVLARCRSLFPDLKRIQQIVHPPMCGFAGASRFVSADESAMLFSGLFIHETLFKTGCTHKQRPVCAGFPLRKSSYSRARCVAGRCAVCASVLSPMKRFFGMLRMHADGLQRFPCRQKLGIALAQTSLKAWPR